jgi:uncharacterized protein (TIGR01244 family)
MQIEQLTNQISVSGQITVEDVQSFVDQRVELLVCNRPDGEDEGQTEYKLIEAEANRLGLPIKLLAFSSYQITPENRDAFINMIQTRQRIHCYCRSGARSKRLWREANFIIGGEPEYDAKRCDDSGLSAQL